MTRSGKQNIENRQSPGRLALVLIIAAGIGAGVALLHLAPTPARPSTREPARDASGKAATTAPRQRVRTDVTVGGRRYRIDLPAAQAAAAAMTPGSGAG